MTATPNDAVALEQIDLDYPHISWSVRVQGDGIRVVQWVGTVTVSDERDRETEVGTVLAYMAPEAAYRGDTFDHLDEVSNDLLTIASVVCGKHGALREDLQDEFRSNSEQGLLIIDQIELIPEARGRGLVPKIISNLVRCCQGAGLVALYASPPGGGDMSEDVLKHSKKRLAKMWQGHGFHAVPKGRGVHVADPDSFIINDDSTGWD